MSTPREVCEGEAAEKEADGPWWERVGGAGEEEGGGDGL